MSVLRFLVSFLFLISLAPWALAHHGSPVPEARGLRDSETISAAPLVNSPTAATLGKNRGMLGFTFDHVRFNKIPADDAHRLHHEGRDVHGKNHEEFFIFSAGFGLLDGLDLYLTAPIVSKSTIQIESHRALGKRERSSSFGDMRFLGKYRFWKNVVEAALLTGIKYPTGETSNKDSVKLKFAPEQQPGTGSWDGDFGLAASRSRSFHPQISWATSFLYTLHGEGGQDFKAGDVFRYNLGISAALREPGKYPNLSGVLEFNHEWALRDHLRTENQVFDSGGTTMFVTPGLIAHLTPTVSLFCAMPVLLYQNLGGEHEELKYEILAGIGFGF